MVWGSASNATSAKVSCNVDGLAVQVDPIPTSELNRFRLCYTKPGQVTSGTHRLTLSISSTDTKSLVGVHSTQYLSKPGIDTRSRISAMYVNSSGVELVGGGWSSFQDDNGVSRWMAWNEDSSTSLRLSFNGTCFCAIVAEGVFGVMSCILGMAAELYGFFWAGAANLSSNTATYSIDGGPVAPFELPSSFAIPGLTAGTNQVYPQIPMLRTVPLKPGDHTLEIRLNNPIKAIPLTFDYFLIYHGSIRSDNGSKGKLGPIVGAILGGLLVIAILAYLLYRHFSQRAQQKKMDQVGLGHYHCIHPSPFIEFEDHSMSKVKPIVVEISQTRIMDSGGQPSPLLEVSQVFCVSEEQGRANTKGPGWIAHDVPDALVVHEDQPPRYSA